MSRSKDGKWSGTRRITVRVNNEEMEEALTEIQARGINRTEFIRNAIISAVDELKKNDSKQN